MDFTTDLKCELKMVDFGSLKALATVRLGPIGIRGFKIIDQGDGKPWIGMPSREVTKNGKKEYYDIVIFQDDDIRRAFCKKILDEYTTKFRSEEIKAASRKRKILEGFESDGLEHE